MKKIKVGITAQVNGARFFTNGLFQNLWTLASVLRDCGQFEVSLLSAEKTDKKDCFGINTETFSTDSLKSKDILIQGAFTIPCSFDSFLRKNNIRVVVLKYGNTVGGDFSTYIQYNNDFKPNFESTDWLRTNRAIEPDLLLYSPHFRGLEQYFSCTANTPISKLKEAPYIWSPIFFEAHRKNMKVSTKYTIGDDKNKRLAFVEPSISFLKTNLVPIMMSNELYKESSEVIDKCYAFGSKGLIEGVNGSRFREKIKDIPLYRDGVLSFENRIGMTKIMGEMAKVLVSHQIMCALNYTYLEFAYNHCPFVHNSDLLSNYGYYYESINILDGKDMIREALAHDELSEKEQLIYANSCDELIWKFSRHNPKNVRGYIENLKAIL
tara:strand:+ start:5598 stop:6737 length:1140 start_codon:yes stop_codon:yes gene_type:complete